MKLVYNNIIPFPGFRCINLFGILFVRSKFRGTLTRVVLNHENIHSAQIKDCLYVFYYPLYVLFWLIEVLRPPYNSAYKDNCFEREAQLNETNLNYLRNRKANTGENKKLYDSFFLFAQFVLPIINRISKRHSKLPKHKEHPQFFR